MFHLALLEIFHTSFPFLPKCKKTLKIHVLHLNSYLGGTYNLPGVLSGKKNSLSSRSSRLETTSKQYHPLMSVACKRAGAEVVRVREAACLSLAAAPRGAGHAPCLDSTPELILASGVQESKA